MKLKVNEINPGQEYVMSNGGICSFRCYAQKEGENPLFLMDFDEKTFVFNKNGDCLSSRALSIKRKIPLTFERFLEINNNVVNINKNHFVLFDGNEDYCQFVQVENEKCKLIQIDASNRWSEVVYDGHEITKEAIEREHPHTLSMQVITWDEIHRKLIANQ